MKPLFRWAGSKARLVDALEKRVPATMHAYHEPFCGSAALFSFISPTRTRARASRFETTPR
jgi:site-specific DNA-adenine methylase